MTEPVPSKPAARDSFHDYLKQIVFGGNDGIITTFAVVAGFAGAEVQGAAQIGALAVLVFGLANLTADAVSMGLGEFLSGRSNRDLYHARYAQAMRNVAADPDRAAERMAVHLAEHGLAAEAARHTADHLATSPALMADLILRYDHGMEAPESSNLARRALMTFLAFIAFGSIPILPFVIFAGQPQAFPVSVAATGLALVLLGLLRWSVTREALGRSMGETLVLGTICAAVAYGAGLMMGGLG